MGVKASISSSSSSSSSKKEKKDLIDAPFLAKSTSNRGRGRIPKSGHTTKSIPPPPLFDKTVIFSEQGGKGKGFLDFIRGPSSIHASQHQQRQVPNPTYEETGLGFYSADPKRRREFLRSTLRMNPAGSTSPPPPPQSTKLVIGMWGKREGQGRGPPCPFSAQKVPLLLSPLFWVGT